MRILFGGSPCTRWSCMQKNAHRETAPGQGPGWELFECFVKAKEAFEPDFFLYENVASMAKPIKDAITEALGVEPVMINSALVSAQSRKRLYWASGNVRPPEDRGLMARQVLGGAYPANITGRETPEGVRQKLETRETLKGKTGALTTSHKDCMALEPDPEGEAEAKGGRIYWKGRDSNTSLPDGRYAIRKMTVAEFRELQTLPAWYRFPEEVSPTQQYRMLGNGWTIEAIKHIIMQWCLMRHWPLDVLSMFDGMAGAHIALDDLGYGNIERYRASEIDKWAIMAAKKNFPDIEHIGDAKEINWETLKQR